MNKKKLIIYILFSVIVMLLSGTFSYYQMVASAEEDSTELYTGTLSVSYSNSDGSIIYNKMFYPRSTPSLDDLEYTYSNTFDIVNTGSLDGIIDVNLVITNCDFMENSLGYNLYNNGNIVSSGFISPSDDMKLISNVYLSSKDTVTYTLIIWLNESNSQQNSNANKRLSASILVNEKQAIKK